MNQTATKIEETKMPLALNRLILHAVLRAGSLYPRQSLEEPKKQVARHIIDDEPDLHDAVDQTIS